MNRGVRVLNHDQPQDHVLPTRERSGDSTHTRRTTTYLFVHLGRWIMSIHNHTFVTNHQRSNHLPFFQPLSIYLSLLPRSLLPSSIGFFQGSICVQGSGVGRSSRPRCHQPAVCRRARVCARAHRDIFAYRALCVLEPDQASQGSRPQRPVGGETIYL